MSTNDKQLSPDLAKGEIKTLSVDPSKNDAKTPNLDTDKDNNAKPVQKGSQKLKMKSLNSIKSPAQILGRPEYPSGSPCPKDSDDCPRDYSD